MKALLTTIFLSAALLTGCATAPHNPVAEGEVLLEG